VSELYAKLLIDTARVPHGLGARGASVAERQLVYRHAALQLDLMLLSGDPAATFVWGQLFRTGSGRPCEGVKVALLDEDERTVGQSTTDAFGEFSFAAPSVDEGALAVESPRGRFLCWLAPEQAARA
jgi:hypothetical protein